mmetsp:Transcript_104082/g.294370  ORF Transcript_104082/g.294370 Transcript_104082/m.294370 type:complete len:217 (-) Transcript_104082:8-658(-)
MPCPVADQELCPPAQCSPPELGTWLLQRQKAGSQQVDPLSAAARPSPWPVAATLGGTPAPARPCLRYTAGTSLGAGGCPAEQSTGPWRRGRRLRGPSPRCQVGRPARRRPPPPRSGAARRAAASAEAESPCAKRLESLGAKQAARLGHLGRSSGLSAWGLAHPDLQLCRSLGRQRPVAGIRPSSARLAGRHAQRQWQLPDCSLPSPLPSPDKPIQT